MNIKIDGEIIKQTKAQRYLGSVISEDGKSTSDLRERIDLAKLAFVKKKGLLTYTNIDIKKKPIKTFVWSVLLYGSESWMFDENQLEAFETWCCRRIERIGTERIRNEEVYRRIEEDRSLLKELKKR